jgi:signal peptidase I
MFPAGMRKLSSPPKRRPVWLWSSLVLVLLLAWFRTQFSFVLVSGESMVPTFRSGDLLLVKTKAYAAAVPERGDIVVERYKGELMVKRVAGLPQEEIELREGALYINGKALVEPYAVHSGGLSVGKGTLAQGKFATVGDNRALSASQAVHPIVTVDEIVGKVVFAFHFGNRAARSG